MDQRPTFRLCGRFCINVQFLDALYGGDKLTAQQRSAILEGAEPWGFGLSAYDLFWLTFAHLIRVPASYIGHGTINDYELACLRGSSSPLQAQIDELRAQLAALQPANGVPEGAHTAKTNIALPSAAVVKRIGGGGITLASGALSGDSDGVIGVALAADSGATAFYFPTGSRAPIAGLPVGPLFRSSAGVLTATPAAGIYTIAMGFSDGEGVDVEIDSTEFKV